jgi:hypothetical protein
MALIFASVSLELAPRTGLAIGAAFVLLAAVIAGLAEKGEGNDHPAWPVRQS